MPYSHFVTVSFPRSLWYYCTSNGPRWNFISLQLHPDRWRRYDFIHFSLFDRSCGGPSCTYARTHTYTHVRVVYSRTHWNAKKTVSPIRVDLWVSRSRIIALLRIILLCTIYYIREFIVLPRCVYIYTSRAFVGILFNGPYSAFEKRNSTWRSVIRFLAKTMWLSCYSTPRVRELTYLSFYFVLLQMKCII